MTVPSATRTRGWDLDDAKGPATAWVFFWLVFAMSVPFYFVGLTGWRLPGLPMLPLSALMGFVPMTAALILVVRSGGGSAVGRFLARLLGPISRTMVVWLCVAVIFMPLVCMIEYAVLLQRDVALPAFSFDAANALFLFAAFFVGAIGEEAGWQGYAYPALRKFHTALGAALIIGVVWAAWHILPFVQLGRGVGWIFWHSLSTVALRVIIVRLFDAAGQRVMIAVVFHAMINLSWAVFPLQGSAYDPFVAFMILTPIAAIAALLGMVGTLRGGISNCAGPESGGVR